MLHIIELSSIFEIEYNSMLQLNHITTKIFYEHYFSPD